LFPRSSLTDAAARNMPPALTWSGPVLAVLFVLGVLALVLLAAASPLARWLLGGVMTPERMLPPLGLGLLFGLIGTRALIAAVVFFALGIAAGLLAEDRLLWLLDTLPRAPMQMFYTGPLAFLTLGGALIAGEKVRPWLAPPAALIAAAMLTLIVRMTDPSLREPAYTFTPLLIAAWLAATVALMSRAFGRRWLTIFARIFGSWLLAIGLLYGGVGLLEKPLAAPPPSLPGAARQPR
jgi:hypothetical protein